MSTGQCVRLAVMVATLVGSVIVEGNQEKIVRPRAGAPENGDCWGTHNQPDRQLRDRRQEPLRQFRRVKFKVTDVPLHINRLVVDLR